MASELKDGKVPDLGLVDAVSLPAAGRVPDPVTGAATGAEYDRYFRITRADGDLEAWTRSCVAATGALLDDLPEGGLHDAERADLLHGLVLVLRSTLNKWLTAVPAKPGPEPS
jgi:hypothetical protein